MADHEIKYVFPATQSANIIQWLKSRCVEDGQYSRGIISSVYYDTIDWNFLHEKINSDYLKTKYRLRWYQEVDSKVFSPRAYFEQKNKIGSARKKTRIELPVEDAIRNAHFLNEPYFIDLPNKVFCKSLQPVRSIVPVFQISYVRHRFVDITSGARLAVDTDIHVPRINPAMVSGHKKTALKDGVFEHKSGEMNLPDWLHGVTMFGCRRGAFSKYSNCYTHIQD